MVRSMVAKLSGPYVPPPGMFQFGEPLRQQTTYPTIWFQHEPGMKMAVFRRLCEY
ncbi:hypothetical protein JMG10_47035 [Nostoc ellipsosporum NOK]|nr:hypothetical protein [Nostoc ellipsosporum NOK]